MFTNCTRPVVFSSLIAIGFTALVLSVEGITAMAGASPVEAYGERVSQYMQLRRQLTEQLQMTGKTDGGATNVAVRMALARATRSARRDARAGDVFGVEVADRIRELVRRDMSGRGAIDRRAVVSEVPPAARVEVNDQYPEGAPVATMPPLLLKQLPPLPPELQYRFLQDTVILLDVDANLIVDVVPHALTRGR